MVLTIIIGALGLCVGMMIGKWLIHWHEDDGDEYTDDELKDIEIEDGIIQEASMFNGKEAFVLTDNNKYYYHTLVDEGICGITNPSAISNSEAITKCFLESK